MAILPKGSTISIAGNTVFVDDLNKTFAVEPFDRLEFSHERLRTAPNEIGARSYPK